MKDNTKALFYVFACVVLWAMIPIVSKLGQAQLDNHQFLFWSSVVSFLTFIGILAFQKQGKAFLSLTSGQWLTALFLGFLGTYLYYILLYFGYAHVQGLEVLVIQYTWPIFVILLSLLLLKERLTIRKSISMILGFLGVVFVLTKGELGAVSMQNLLVDGIVLCAACVFGLFSVLSKKIEFNPLVLVTVYFLAATIFSFISMLVFSHWSLPSSAAIVPIIINGIFVNGISYIFWIQALKHGEATFVAPFVFLTPVISTLLLVLFFHEAFELGYILGISSVILAGVINRETKT